LASLRYLVNLPSNTECTALIGYKYNSNTYVEAVEDKGEARKQESSGDFQPGPQLKCQKATTRPSE